MGARRTRRELRRFVIGAGSAAFLACNSLTGVNDLEIRSTDPLTPDSEPLGGAMGGAAGGGGTMTEPPDLEMPAAGSGGTGAEPPAGGSSGASASGSACDLVSGAGCGSDETCRLTEPLLLAECLPLGVGAVEPYAPCSSDADCGALHSCVDSVCERHCATEADCPWPGALCAGVRGELRVCTRNCDPVFSSAPRPGFQPCGAGARCTLYGAEPPFSDCIPSTGASALPEGAACTLDAECGDASLCVDQRCRDMCDPAAPLCAGVSCASLVALGANGVGVCDTRPCDPVNPTPSDVQFRACALGEYCLPGLDTEVATCIPASGASAYGEACDVHSTCAPGLACLSGTCHPWCRTGSACPTAMGEFCILDLVQVADGVPLVYQAIDGDPVGICSP